MAENKKYYYLKLKENSFDSDQMIVLESLPDGHLFSNILLKLYLRSLKNGGKLFFNNNIPYTLITLSQVVRHPIKIVEKALEIFKELGLIEILDDGAIFMLDIQNYIEKSTTEAEREREYQKRIKIDKECLLSKDKTSKCKKSNRKSNSTNEKSNQKSNMEPNVESNRKSDAQLELEQEQDLEKDLELDLEKNNKDLYSKNIDLKNTIFSFEELIK